MRGIYLAPAPTNEVAIGIALQALRVQLALLRHLGVKEEVLEKEYHRRD